MLLPPCGWSLTHPLGKTITINYLSCCRHLVAGPLPIHWVRVDHNRFWICYHCITLLEAYHSGRTVISVTNSIIYFGASAMLTLSHRVFSIKIFVYSQLAPNLLAQIKCHQFVHLPDTPCTYLSNK